MIRNLQTPKDHFINDDDTITATVAPPKDETTKTAADDEADIEREANEALSKVSEAPAVYKGKTKQAQTFCFGVALMQNNNNRGSDQTKGSIKDRYQSIQVQQSVAVEHKLITKRLIRFAF